MQNQKWHKVIEVATTRFRGPNYAQIIEVAKDLFPDEMEIGEASAIYKGLVKEIKDAMRSAIDLEESGEGITEQVALPGMAPPAYLRVKTETDGEFVPVKYSNSVRHERLQAIEERRQAAGKITARADDLQMKEDFLAPYISNPWETLNETLRKVKKHQSGGEPEDAAA